MVLVLAAPLAATRGRGTAWAVAVATYAVGARVCHQRPDRSFHVNAIQLPVCARCTGLYLGAVLGAACGMTRTRPRPMRVGTGVDARLLLALAALPTAATFVLEWAGSAVSGAGRAAAGAVLSAAASRLIAVALVGNAGSGEVN
jgi:hypothetical protein